MGSTKQIGVKMTEETKPKAFPWKTVGYFNSFQAADKKRNTLLEGNTPADQVEAKVKRCGPGGSKFMVKSRLNPKYDKPKEKKKTKKKGK